MRWILILVILVVVIFLFMNKPLSTPVAPSAPQETPVAAVEATPAPAPPSQPAQPPTLDPNLIARLKAAARATGCELIGAAPAPGGAVVAVSWVSDNSAIGGDFIEECTKQGIFRDFDENNVKMGGGVTKDGRNAHTAQYNVRF